MSMKQYKGVSGEFEYDNEMFIVDCNGLLRFRAGYKGPIDLPKGVTSCRTMFANCDLTNCYLRAFDTSLVTDMLRMFDNCKLPEGFMLGDKFDTSKVTVMTSMFCGCKLPEGFTLGDKFDTANVTDTSRMFECCKLPEGFTLGDKFDTSKVETMQEMFYGCTCPENFTLSSKFHVAKVEDMKDVFKYAKLPSRCEGLVRPFAIIEVLRDAAATFDCVEYLKTLFGEQFNDLPYASVANCETKADCDDLYNRFM